MDYDGLGMLTSMQTPTGTRLYVYDAQNERVMRWDCALDLCGPDTSQERITLRGLDGQVLRAYEGKDRKSRRWSEDTIYLDGRPLVRIINNGNGGDQPEALHLDHLGSVRQVTAFWESGEDLVRHPKRRNYLCQFTGARPIGSGAGIAARKIRALGLLES